MLAVAPSRSGCAGSIPAARSAGSTPARPVAAAISAAANPQTRQPRSSDGAKFSKPASGRRTKSASRSHTASSSPTAVAAPVATRLSASHSRAMSARVAPSAIRTAISPRRSLTVASDALATLAQAASNASAATARAKTRPRRRSGVSDSGSVEAGTTDKPSVRFSRRVLGAQRRRNRRHLGARARQRHARRQPRRRLQPAPRPAPDVEPARPHDVVGHQRHPEVGVQRVVAAVERCRGHAGHGEHRAVQVQRAADHGGVRRELAAPPAVADHGDARRAGAVVVRRQRAAERRGHAEGPEVAAADQLDGGIGGLVAEAVGGEGLLVNRHPVERAGAIGDVLQVGIRGDAQGGDVAGAEDPHQRDPRSGTGSGRSSRPLATANIALVPPMPMASVATVVAVSTGRAASTRTAWTTSRQELAMAQESASRLPRDDAIDADFSRRAPRTAGEVCAAGTRSRPGQRLRLAASG